MNIIIEYYFEINSKGISGIPSGVHVTQHSKIQILQKKNDVTTHKSL